MAETPTRHGGAYRLLAADGRRRLGPYVIDLNTRDIALLVWLAIFAVSIPLFIKGSRSSAVALVKAFFVPKIIIPIALAAFYIAGCVWLLAKLGIWEPKNLKTVIFWFVGTAFFAMMDLPALERGAKTLKGVVADAFAVSTVISFLSGINTFPFFVELLLLPLLAFLTMLIVVGEQNPQHVSVVRFITWLLVLAGLVMFAYSIYQIYADWQKLEGLHQVREFAVPLALTFLFLPFLYCLMLYMAYENSTFSLRYVIPDRSLRRQVWLRGLPVFGLHLELFKRYMQAIKAGNVSGPEDVKRVIQELRQARRREKTRPPVAWEDGWSPDVVRDYLADQGLRTNPYRRSGHDWWAESPLIDIGGGVFPDRLAYRIQGTATAVTRLSLELHVNTAEAIEQADESFWQAAHALIRTALGDDATVVSLQTANGSFSTSARGCDLRVTRDDWGTHARTGYSRRLTIRHPAHIDQFPGLD